MAYRFGRGLVYGILIGSFVPLGAAAGIGYMVRPAQSQSATVPATINGSGGSSSLVFESLTPANLTYSYNNSSSSNVLVAGGESRRPPGAMYHQVVDRYFDRDGSPIEVKSKTHVVDNDCGPGRRQQDLVASIQDDGKGNVKFFPTEVYAAPQFAEVEERGQATFLRADWTSHVTGPTGITMAYIGGDGKWVVPASATTLTRETLEQEARLAHSRHSGHSEAR